MQRTRNSNFVNASLLILYFTTFSEFFTDRRSLFNDSKAAGLLEARPAVVLELLSLSAAVGCKQHRQTHKITR